jgi:hypothetical protein
MNGNGPFNHEIHERHEKGKSPVDLYFVYFVCFVVKNLSIMRIVQSGFYAPRETGC